MCFFLVSLHRVQTPNSQREDNAADYWRVHSKALPLALRAVVQSVFGCPSSVGVTERDFYIADMFAAKARFARSGVVGHIHL